MHALIAEAAVDVGGVVDDVDVDDDERQRRQRPSVVFCCWPRVAVCSDY